MVGATGFVDTGNTITFPNIWIEPNATQTITVDARVDFYQDADKKISTTPEIIVQNRVSIIKSQQVAVIAKGLSPEQMKSMFKGNNI